MTNVSHSPTVCLMMFASPEPLSAGLSSAGAGVSAGFASGTVPSGLSSPLIIFADTSTLAGSLMVCPG